MRIAKKVTLVVASMVLGGLTLAAILLWAFSSPLLADACVGGYERCNAAARGTLAVLDCRIEMLHCRAYGPEHWPVRAEGAPAATEGRFGPRAPF